MKHTAQEINNIDVVLAIKDFTWKVQFGFKLGGWGWVSGGLGNLLKIGGIHHPKIPSVFLSNFIKQYK